MKIIFKTDEENQNMINDQAKLGGERSSQGASTARSAAEQRSCSTSKFMNAADKKLFGETSLAIQKSDKLLTIFDYIEAVNFKIDTFMLDKFWQCIAENRCVSKKLISYLRNQFKK